jgi:acyl carrier protein
MADHLTDTVYAALARQLKVPVERLLAQSAESLDRLGLDSHGLMRVLLDIERELKLSTSLELPDEALENPATLAAGVKQVVGGT